MSLVELGARLPIALLGIGLVFLANFIMATWIAGQPMFLIGDACTKLLTDINNNAVDDTSYFFSRMTMRPFCQAVPPGLLNTVQTLASAFMVIVIMLATGVIAAFATLGGVFRVRE